MASLPNQDNLKLLDVEDGPPMVKRFWSSDLVDKIYDMEIHVSDGPVQVYKVQSSAFTHITPFNSYWRERVAYRRDKTQPLVLDLKGFCPLTVRVILWYVYGGGMPNCAFVDYARRFVVAVKLYAYNIIDTGMEDGLKYIDEHYPGDIQTELRLLCEKEWKEYLSEETWRELESEGIIMEMEESFSCSNGSDLYQGLRPFVEKLSHSDLFPPQILALKKAVFYGRMWDVFDGAIEDETTLLACFIYLVIIRPIHGDYTNERQKTTISPID